jgi:hypothetical protein
MVQEVEIVLTVVSPPDAWAPRLACGSLGTFTMLGGDEEVQARARRVERLHRHACGEKEFPYVVSNMAKRART